MGEIWAQIETQDVYFPNKKLLLKNICGSKVMVTTVSKGHYSASFFKWFEVILSCDYFWTVKITSITLRWHI